MKKVLCGCVALTLALGSFGAVAEQDLQAQLDAANAKIAELQAQVDAYYPFYAAQVVATYGDDGVIWLEDVEAEYAAVEAQYAGYGISLANYGLVDTTKKDIVDAAVRNAVLLEKATELGLDQFDEEKTAELAASAQATFDEYVNYYISYFYADAEEVTDEMRQEAEKYWAEGGMSLEQIQESLTQSAVMDAVYDYAVKDVAIEEADVQASYEALIEANKANYADDRSYNADRSGGATIAWNPEGYRAVKHVLVMFNDEQAQKYSELQSQLSSLNAELEAIENPVEATAAPEATAEAEATPEPTPEPRSAEEVQAEIDACTVELDSLYGELMPRAEEVIAAFDEGTSFDELIKEYNEDPGMQNEPTASIGYAVSANSTYWEQPFTDGAMSIAEKGGISDPVRGSNGIHIIYYMDDVPAGEVALEEIREAVETQALDEKLNATYENQVSAWVEEAAPEYHYESFGIAAAE